MDNNIEFTSEKCKKFNKAYKDAVAKRLSNFIFEGHELNTDYAKYLLEYLHTKFEF